MKVKVSELQGAMLDYWVAKAEVVSIERRGRKQNLYTQQGVVWRPSSDWSQGGPIIERNAGTFGIAGNDQDFNQVSYWAEMGRTITRCRMVGPTHLIAAMRAYVASKFGEEVEE